MTNISFDMRRIGATIARLRQEQNMTQMQLADEMGVSFQAISNWERGLSMPDISKLPELANLFDTTIDHLLSRKSPVIEAAVNDTLEELVAREPIDLKDLTAAAPLLTPQQMNDVSQDLNIDGLDHALLPNLLPFLATAKVDELFQRAAEKNQNICSFLPFASTDVIDDLARSKAATAQDVTILLPFMSGKAIDAIAIELLRKGERIDQLLPFISSKLINQLSNIAFPDK